MISLLPLGIYFSNMSLFRADRHSYFIITFVNICTIEAFPACWLDDKLLARFSETGATDSNPKAEVQS